MTTKGSCTMNSAGMVEARVDAKNAFDVKIVCAAEESGDDKELSEKFEVERVCMTNSAGVLEWKSNAYASFFLSCLKTRTGEMTGPRFFKCQIWLHMETVGREGGESWSQDLYRVVG